MFSFSFGAIPPSLKLSASLAAVFTCSAQCSLNSSEVPSYRTVPNRPQGQKSKRDLIKKKDKLENEGDIEDLYKETKGLFDILKKIYEGLAYSTSSLDGYEKDLKIMNPGGEFKTFYENQKVALNNLKNLIKLDSSF